MNCDEVAESISALFDACPLPGAMMEHISSCELCSTRLNDYAEISAKLRRFASAVTVSEIPHPQWKSSQPALAPRFVASRNTVRIPRFAFALMVLALVALTTGLLLVRAKERNRWFQFQVHGRDGKQIVSATVPADSGADPYYNIEAGMPGADGTVWFFLRALEQHSGAETIGARTLWVPQRVGVPPGGWTKLRALPERQFFCVPGRRLAIPVNGYGNLEIDRQFQAKLPDNVRFGLYPPDDTFQILPPVVLVRGDRMLSKADIGGGQYLWQRGYFGYYSPGSGWYLFSSKPLEGAVQGKVSSNQIEFDLGGQKHFLFTGAPITFGTTNVWVAHYWSLTEADPSSSWTAAGHDMPEFAFGELQNLRSK